LKKFGGAARALALALLGSFGVVAGPGCTAPGDERRDPAAAAADAIALTAPFSEARASFLYAALDVPRMQPAATLPPGEGLLRLSSDHAKTVHAETIDGHRNRMDTIFHEFAALEGAWGVVPGLEIGSRFAFAGWDEEQDVFSILDQNGQPIVNHESPKFFDTGSSRRHLNLSSVEVRAKARLLEGESPLDALSLGLTLGIPVARAEDLTNAGTWDLGLTLLGSKALGDWTLHGNAGVVFPLGNSTLFEDGADVDVTPFFQAGAGATWQFAANWAAIAQVEGNTSGFRGNDFLDDAPLTIFAGLRRSFGRVLLETGVGVGVFEQSSYDFAWRIGVAWRF